MAIQQIKLGNKNIITQAFSRLSTASGSTTAPSKAADIRSSTTPIINMTGCGEIYHLYIPPTAMVNIEINNSLSFKGYTGSKGSDIINLHSFLYKPIYDGNNLCSYVPVNGYTSKDTLKKIIIDSDSELLSNYAAGKVDGSLSSTVIASGGLSSITSLKIYVYSYLGTGTNVVSGTIWKQL